jgi:hypothetical protein
MNNYKTRLIGKTFGLLTVESFDSLAKGNKTVWLCQCSCGKKKLVRNDSLIQGTTKSCGCLNEKKGNESKGWKGYQEIYGGYWNRIRSEARKRGLKFNFTIEKAWDLFLSQQKRCALTGEEIRFGSSLERTASLDRIDSSKGYEEGNVQWVTKEVNFAKQSLSQKDFVELCKRVSAFMGNKC